MALARVRVSVGAAIVLAFVTSAATPLLAETETYELDPAASAVDFTVYASKISDSSARVSSRNLPVSYRSIRRIPSGHRSI